MLPLAGPILAQMITLSVGDRTEARYVAADEKYVQGATRPLVGLNFGWKRGSVALAYTPSITVSPLDHKPRDVLFFQAAVLTGSYHWRRTTLSLSEGVGYGDITFQVRALADPGANPTPTTGTNNAGPATGPTAPATPTGTPIPGNGMNPAANPQATDQRRIKNQVVHYGSSVTSLGVGHTLSREVSIGGGGGYAVAGGLDGSRDLYPSLSGAFASAFMSHHLSLSRRNDFTFTLSTQYALSSTGNRSLGVSANEGWAHRLDARTSTNVAVGVAASRLSQRNGTVAISIYPAGNAGIAHVDRFARGTVTFGFGASAAPYLDPLRATIDPRLSFSASTSWAKDRFSIGLGAGAAISLTGDDKQGAVNSIGASLVSTFRLGAGFSLDAGAATGWQSFEGATIIPASWTGFLGVTWGASVALNGNGH